MIASKEGIALDVNLGEYLEVEMRLSNMQTLKIRYIQLFCASWVNGGLDKSPQFQLYGNRTNNLL